MGVWAACGQDAEIGSPFAVAPEEQLGLGGEGSSARALVAAVAVADADAVAVFPIVARHRTTQTALWAAQTALWTALFSSCFLGRSGQRRVQRPGARLQSRWERNAGQQQRRRHCAWHLGRRRRGIAALEEPVRQIKMQSG